jgi:hypothetical protein
MNRFFTRFLVLLFTMLAQLSFTMPLWAGASQTFGMAEHFTGLRFGSMDDSLCSGELSTVKLRNDSAARESGMPGVFG